MANSPVLRLFLLVSLACVEFVLRPFVSAPAVAAALSRRVGAEFDRGSRPSDASGPASSQKAPGAGRQDGPAPRGADGPSGLSLDGKPVGGVDPTGSEFGGASFDYFRPYVGLSYQVSRRSGGSTYYQVGNPPVGAAFGGMRVFEGLSPHVGVRFGRYIAVEVGFAVTNWSRSSWTDVGAAPDRSRLRLRSMFYGPSVDILGYYPIRDDGVFDLVGVTGFSCQNFILQARAADGGLSSRTDSLWLGLGMHMGGGLAYHVNRHVDLRSLLQYQLVSCRFGDRLPKGFAGSGTLALSLSISFAF